MLTEQEIEIIKGCKKGDPACQKRLYLDYGPLVKGICLRYTGDADEAGDLFHDVFIFVLTHFAEFGDITSLGGWIRRITINKCIDYLRHKKIKEAIPMSQIEYDLPRDDGHEYDEIPMEVLLGFINRLKPKTRTAFNLFIIDGYEQEEIARMMDESQNNVRTMISRARSVLREKIRKYLRNEEYTYL